MTHRWEKVITRFSSLKLALPYKAKREVRTPDLSTPEQILTVGGNINMSDRLQDMDVMKGWKSFLDTHNQAMGRYVPKAGGNLKSKKPWRKQPLWMNEKALSKVKKKKAAFARYVQTRKGKDYQEYAKERN